MGGAGGRRLRLRPVWGSVLSRESAPQSFPLPLPLLVLSFSLCQINTSLGNTNTKKQKAADAWIPSSDIIGLGCCWVLGLWANFPGASNTRPRFQLVFLTFKGDSINLWLLLECRF